MTQITLQEFCHRMICSRPSRGEVCGFPRQRLMWVTRGCPERKKDYTARISLRIFFKKYIIADNTIFMPEIQFIEKIETVPRPASKPKPLYAFSRSRNRSGSDQTYLVAESEPSCLPVAGIGTRIIKNSPVLSLSRPWHTLPGTEAEKGISRAFYSKTASKSLTGYFPAAGVASKLISLNH